MADESFSRGSNYVASRKLSGTLRQFLDYYCAPKGLPINPHIERHKCVYLASLKVNFRENSLYTEADKSSLRTRGLGFDCARARGGASCRWP